jgi:replication-associated recombination protein RarA
MNDAFSAIIGHAGAVERMRRAFSGGRFPHAAVISGRRHLGKRTLAEAAAAALLGPGKLAVHPDFRAVERPRDAKTGKLRKSIGIDEIRVVREFLQMSALSGGRKVALIDEAETMSEEAANALLKILEEPPASSFVILVAHDASRLPATVRSRSASFPLSAVSDAAIADALERLETPPAAVERIVAYAAGRPGVALALRENGDMIDWYASEERRWRSLRGAPLHRRFTLLSDLAPAGDDREECLGRLRDVISFWENALRQELRDGSLSAARLLRGIQELRKTLEFNVQPRLLLEKFAINIDV